MKTLLLDPTPDANGDPIWDLLLDSDGNIAVASEPYSQAQDAASAIRTFAGECWYDTTLGIPWLEEILAVSPMPQLSYIKTLLTDAALAIPGVVSAQVFVSDVADRMLHGQVQITNTAGQTAAACCVSTRARH
jgi:hypothetical protein